MERENKCPQDIGAPLSLKSKGTHKNSSEQHSFRIRFLFKDTYSDSGVKEKKTK